MIASAIHEYLVSYGKSGDFSRFASLEGDFQRGDRVVLRSVRGLEIGTILRPATSLQQRVLDHLKVGELLRRATSEDERAFAENQNANGSLFDAARSQAQQDNVPLEILDVDLLLDGRTAVIQYLAWENVALEPFWESFAARHNLQIVLDNLARSPAAEDTGHGCGEPNCGKANGGCSDCSTGGCSSCARNEDVTLRDYFAHLRTKMESEPGRIGLL
jgi:cell fate regulator YaaT (PSP1 superfamily)